MKDNLIERRDFLKYSGMGAVTIAASDSTIAMASSSAPAISNAFKGSMTSKTDVLVVGGGTAGTIAAIQSARAGTKTLLVERGTQLGGTVTTGGVSFPGLFDAWGKQIIAGIGWELVEKSVKLDGGSFPDFNKVPKHHFRNQVHVNQFLYALLAEEACIKAGVTIAYYESPMAAESTGDGWKVVCTGPGIQRTVTCKQIIDCTGGASVVGMLNLPRLRESETQPGSLLYKLGGEHPVGRKQLDRLYVHGADSSTSLTLTQANLQGRKSLLAKVRAKNGKARLVHMQPETAHRESYRILGETVVSVDDYTSGKVFKDAVCYAFYPVDLHTKSGVKPKPLKPGTVPTVPLSALVPKNSRNIIVAGRCVSSDRLANSGLRVQASCMAMGQAAGAAVALAVKNNTSPGNVPLKDIHKMLSDHDAIIPT